jgi:putative ABC transport system permease protein
LNAIALAIKNIKGSGFRNVIIFLAVMAVTGFLLGTTLIIRGTEYSLNAGIERLGADIIVVPQGAETSVETALLMGKPASIWMNGDVVSQVAAIPGVASASPQLYLASLYGASCCSVWETPLVVYDPQTDFTIKPWLEKKLDRPLAKGEIIGGSNVFIPPGEDSIRLYGCKLSLVGNLQPTGTGLDETIFFTMETAQYLAGQSLTTAEKPLTIPPNSISAVLVKVAPGVSSHDVALRMMLDLKGVAPLESPQLFAGFRSQLIGLLWSYVTFVSIFWALSTVLTGMVFSMAINERRRELAILRAIGATRNFIFRSILAEAGLVALAASLTGVILMACGVYLFRDLISSRLNIPFLFLDFPSFLFLAAIWIAFVAGTVIAAALYPAIRAIRQEPAIAMKEQI